MCFIRVLRGVMSLVDWTGPTGDVEYPNRVEPPARMFGRFRPIIVLGRGGMATVYLATVQGPGQFTKLVVAKELKPELACDPEFGTMFLDEARLAARIHHPNVVQTCTRFSRTTPRWSSLWIICMATR